MQGRAASAELGERGYKGGRLAYFSTEAATGAAPSGI